MVRTQFMFIYTEATRNSRSSKGWSRRHA